MSLPTLETFEFAVNPQGVALLVFNRPERANSLNGQVYKDWLEALTWAAEAPRVKVLVLTGKTGKTGNPQFYSSGQELVSQKSSGKTEDEASLYQKLKVAEALVNALINFPKLLIAGVNGHAIGFAVTTLALFDIVYSVPKATFQTPFVKLGFCAEACSSYLFPKIFGGSIANEFLLMGRKFTAEELEKRGFISRLISSDNFLEKVIEYATEAAKSPPNAMLSTKDQIRMDEREYLRKVNEREIALLAKRMLSEESQQAITEFIAGKTRL